MAGISRRELMIFFYKFRTRLILAFLLPFALSIFASTIPVPLYRVDSVLVVRLGSEYVYQPEVGSSLTGPTSTILFGQEQIFKSEVAILGSDDLHRDVIKAVGVSRLYPEMLNPSTSQKIQRFLMGGFMAYVTPPKQMKPEDAEQYRLELAVAMFAKRFNIMLEKESAVINVSFEHKNRAIAIEALETLLKFYFDKRKQLYLEPRAELAESQMKATREQMLAAQKKVEEFKISHQVYSLEDQRKQLLEKRSDSERRATSINSAALEREIARYNKELESLDSLEREFKALQKEAEIASESYALSSHRFEEAKAYEEVQRERSSSVRVIQPPSAPPEPKKLKTLIILSGFIASLVIALITAAICETSRRGFLTPEEAERQLKLPVLAVLPYTRRKR